MNTFIAALINQPNAVTTNGMPAHKSSSNACVDLFYQIGASRNNVTNALQLFDKALNEDPNTAIRILLWLRDIRGGNGTRDLFRTITVDLLGKLETIPDIGYRILNKIPELGRWDDLLAITEQFHKTHGFRIYAYELIKTALANGNQLCAKWMPRNENKSRELRKYLSLTAKEYRKYIASLTNVVEQKMCKNQWDTIDFSHVPSKAMNIYSDAFKSNAENKWNQYIEDLNNGIAKVNANAIYPYEILAKANSDNCDLVINQWNALPDYLNDVPVLPMIDTSGSMSTPITGSKLQCLDVAVSLGLYITDKSKSAFKNAYLTFNTDSKLKFAYGDNIVEKYLAVHSDNDWGGTTNILSAFENVLAFAKANGVLVEDMPKIVIILSDMQFDDANQGNSYNETAYDHIKKLYNQAGYELPTIVFWNLNAYSNVPVKFNQQNVAMVSGFSPAILKAVLGGDLNKITPYNVMNDAISIDRYNY